MHHHARRLVDDHNVVVLVENIQRNVFRARRLAWDFGQRDQNTLVGFEPIRRLAAAAIHFDPAGHNDAAHQHAAVVREAARQKGIEPAARLSGIDDQLNRLG